MEKIIIANWKMNPKTLKEAEEIFYSLSEVKLDNVSLILCPPFVYMEDMSRLLQQKNISAVLGAQNCHWEEKGAFTGEISVAMLKNFGVEYIIVGHSERRWKMLETDEMINKKIKAILENGLIPILAVGEKKRESNFKDVIIEQLKKDLVGVDSESVKKIIIAYEPVWAIGTGISDKPKDTIEAVKAVKQYIASSYNLSFDDGRVLYGGSINSKNVIDFVSQAEINGVLVGGASIDKEEFRKIIEVVSKI